MIIPIEEGEERPQKTLGEHSYLASLQEPVDADAIELEREIRAGTHSDKSFEEEIWEAVDAGRKNIEGDFFVIVLIKKERLLHNVIRQYFFTRKSCPTPEFDQTVYKYFRKEDELEFIWSIPDNATCMWMPLQEHSLPKDHHWMLSIIKDFKEGKLDIKAKQLNGELDT